ncbi:GGDEF domain-containing protein, partial [uncultured Roseobacter sp.]|uniref:GGDEF domain-containing protein n=1 Tax=uncultured Roseobacter sp. TaxID=114847 RepID=UPI00262BD4B9
MKVIDRPTEDGGRVTFRIDVTETVNRKNELEMAAATDSLTGLSNRRGLAGFLPQAVERLGQDDRLVLMHLDLDKFKAVNDAHGHDAGDFVLEQIAKRLRHHIGEDTQIARAGGDEFVVAQVSRKSNDSIMTFAETLRIAITEPIDF